MGIGKDVIRWMIRRDMQEVVDMEALVYEFPWDESDFINALRQRNCIGMVYEKQNYVLAYMLYELHKTKLHLLNFTVHPGYQRRGIGTAMVKKLFGKLSSERRNRIMLEVRETNLDAQLFFQSLGFEAVDVLKDYYEDTTEDAYVMVRRWDQCVRRCLLEPRTKAVTDRQQGGG